MADFFEGGRKAPEIEEKVLKFWDKEKIFERSLEKTKSGQPFTFYDGPPFATGIPHYGHILASTIKDLVPRYQTMNGRFVRRRWGWDCHGLPIEEIVERKLGISGKKQIEEIGIQKFNETCRSMVLTYVEEWGKMVRRIARWVEFDNSYKTMDRDYMESVWWAFKQIYDKGLVYEGRKVLMYCPRCETPVSNFEVAMDNSYKDVTEEAVTVKFKLKDSQKIDGYEIPENTFVLAWTTTPWTLPGNVALAVGQDITYRLYSVGTENYIVAAARAKDVLPAEAVAKEELKGSDLVGLEYEPIFDVPAVQSEKAHKIYAADFVNTEDGTGVVHTAVVYGEDDYQLGLREGLPVVPLLNEKGVFNELAPEFIRNQYFKDAERFIKKDLEARGLMFKREQHLHSYPHCWRCGNVLYYNAIPAWFVNIQQIKKGLLDSNDREMNWFPDHLKHGRYEKSVEAAPDWNISRNRYWGNPIPVWKCDDCGEKTVAGSIKDLGLQRNTFFVSRHGEANNNVQKIISCYPEKTPCQLTEIGEAGAKKAAAKLKTMGGIDMIVASDLLRTKRTAEIIGEEFGVPVETDERLREYNFGAFNGRLADEWNTEFPKARRLSEAPEGGESQEAIQQRMAEVVNELNAKYEGKRILIVSHGDPILHLQQYFGIGRGYPDFADPFELEVSMRDLHRPYIDDVVIACKKCGGTSHRVPEVFDSWVEAGSMPFAEYHYPFENKETFESRFPAQFVSEYIAQTRAWFYLMHVVSFTIFGKAPVENLVTTGTILAEDGSKMSKSKNNFPDPWETINKYGVDALRFYLMNSVVMQADNFNFNVRDLETVYRKNVMILSNVYNYFATYAKEKNWSAAGLEQNAELEDGLDRWIMVRTKSLVNDVTKYFDEYNTVWATRTIEQYIDDLSTWYLRRSRGREDREFFETLYQVLLTVSQVIAPVMPFLAEAIYKSLVDTFGGEGALSVHLTEWPKAAALTAEEEAILATMNATREAASVGQAIRKAINIPVRQPLPRMRIVTQPEIELTPTYQAILLSELNVKGIAVELEESASVKAGAGSKYVQKVLIDTALTEELEIEGLARGLERAVQELRKREGMSVGEEAKLRYATDSEKVKKAMVLFDKKKTYIGEIVEDDNVTSEAITVGEVAVRFALER